ncbi:peptidylprolyl isomerase [Psychrobacter sp. I-STPA10]|uniref:peptidylprolyl isomerase n=1 Tax=Psychrobacter sp. I-STPA10 TaxID=2585769 RepID=UPI001E44FB11|nr:peptidylprolyl isomerase [Psychrobacter sp. I-STPA10]
MYKKLYTAISVGLLTTLCLSTPAIAAQSNGVTTNTSTQPTITNNVSVANSTDGIIAIVNDSAILKSDLAAAVQQARQSIQASGGRLPPNEQLNQEVLNGLILRELQLDLIQRAGIRPNPEAINQQLQAIAQSQGFSSLSELQQRLDASQPNGYALLRQQIIENESLKALQQRQVAGRVRITEQDIDAYLASPEAQQLEQSEFRTIHIRVPYLDDYSRITEQQREQAMQVAQRVHTALQSTDDANQAIAAVTSNTDINYPVELQGGDMGYHPAAGLPTELANKITKLQVGEVAAPQVTAQGIDVIKLVDKRSDDRLIIPQWHVRHVLVKSNPQQNDALAEQKINDIYQQLQQGADFTAIAATYSDDAGSAGRGGDLEWITEGDTVPAFEAVMKSTPVGSISQPFKSQFGWHILKVEETRKNDVSKQYRRNLAREAIFQRLAPQAQEDWLQELKANAYIKIM